jgi:hypothetical protein
MEVTPYGGLELAAATGVYHTIAGGLMPLVVMLLVTRALPADRRPAGSAWGWTLLAAALFLVPFHLIATFVGPELPTLGGALIGAAGFVVALRLARGRRARPGRTGRGPAAAPGRRALPGAGRAGAGDPAPARPARAARRPHRRLGSRRLRGQLRAALPPGHDAAARLRRGRRAAARGAGEVGGAMRAASAKLVPVSVALFAMLGLSRLMVHAGMIETLAEAAATTVGGMWPLAAPFVGTLGTFVTGSATASNILFTEFQVSTAENARPERTGAARRPGLRGRRRQHHLPAQHHRGRRHRPPRRARGRGAAPHAGGLPALRGPRRAAGALRLHLKRRRMRAILAPMPSPPHAPAHGRRSGGSSRSSRARSAGPAPRSRPSPTRPAPTCASSCSATSTAPTAA